MFRILRNTAPSIERRGGSNPSGRYDDVDLSTWEFVNASQSDDEDLCSFDVDDVIRGCDGVTCGDDPVSEPVQDEHEGARAARGFVSPCDVVSIQSMSVSPPMTLPVEMTLNYHAYQPDGDIYDGDVHDANNDDDGDGDYDDELMPWRLKDKFGKHRIKKLGKRGGPKLNKSKRMPFNYNRPGCLYGKHG
ncbi:hypothetical protein OROGR_031601 [Orobanche gracilis]